MSESSGSSSSRALDSVRVVDFSRGIAGPMAAMLLADFSADVVKVESAEGDPGRRRPGFAMWNRNKRSIVADLFSDAGRAHVHALLAGADICVFGGGGEEAYLPAEFQPEALCATYPSLVVLSATPFLDATPWAGGLESPALLASITGVALRHNSSTGGPVDPSFPHWVYAGAIWATTATVAALIERQHSGQGQHVTVGGVHGTLVTSTPALVIDPLVQEAAVTTGSAGPSALYTLYECQDGRWIFLGALTPKFQRATIKVLGLEDILEDERIAGNFEAVLVPTNIPWVRKRFSEVFASRSSDAWVAILKEAGVPTTVLLDRSEWLASPEIQSVGMRLELDDPTWGKVVMPGNPIRMSATPARIERASPRLGEHTQQLPGWAPRAAGGASAPVAGAGALAGLRIIDVGAVLAGPYAGTLLAELGAEVIKAEIPEGDAFRERGFVFFRGQRGLAIDLTSEAGREAFYDLVRDADIVIDNYRVGVLARLKIEHEDLKKVNPNIITVSITAFGEDSPFSREPAFDGLLQSRSGLFTAQGGNDAPVMISVPIIDGTSALLATLGAVLAAFHKIRTGEGQHVSVTMAGAAALAQCEELIEAQGRLPASKGGADYAGPTAFDRSYRTRDGWIRMQGDADTAPALLAKAGIVSRDAAPPSGDWLATLTSTFAERARDEVVALLNGVGIPAVPARRLGELVADPEYRRWGVFAELDRGSMSPVWVPNRYAHFSRTERQDLMTPAGVGEHSVEVLHDAGFSQERIDRLLEQGAVRQGTPFIYRYFAAYR
ncbi:CaiB/BaiF CoA transferase family protein [Rhodanobacter lindaniclasticus]